MAIFDPETLEELYRVKWSAFTGLIIAYSLYIVRIQQIGSAFKSRTLMLQGHRSYMPNYLHQQHQFPAPFLTRSWAFDLRSMEFWAGGCTL